MHRSLFRRVHPALLVVLCALALIGPALAAMTNGMAAGLVLGQPDFTTNTTATSAEGMRGPFGVAVDPTTGKVFVTDTFNSRVLRFASVAALSNGAAAEGVLGQSNFTSLTGSAGAGGLSFPHSLAVDSAGRLWVADTINSRVLRFDNAADKPNGATADGVLGQSDFTTNTTATSAGGMSAPTSVTVDSAGRLWITDTNNHRVLRFDNAAGKPNGAPADGVLGQPGFNTLTQAVGASGMRGPLGVTVDSAGRLWVADTENNRVLRFDNAADKLNGAPADGVLGQSDFSANTQAVGTSGMNGPASVTVDAAGQLWVADTFNNRVLRFDNAAGKPNGATANGVLGQPDFTTNTSATSAGGMFRPLGVAQDGAGRLWVADTFNNRVLLFQVGEPVLAVSGQGAPIADGSSTPNPANGTDIGRVALGAQAGQTYTIANIGDAPLTLDGTPRVSISGPNAADFSVTVEPDSPVARNGSTSFTIRFAPAAGGTRSATISIASNDTDRNPYTFAIQGTGIPVPIITWANPAAITYGTPLGAAQLNATAGVDGQPVAGAFSYTPPAGAVLPAGSGQILRADFTPDEPGMFSSAQAQVTITVAPAQLEVRADNQTVMIGRPLPPLTWTYAGFVNGEASDVLTGAPVCTTAATAGSPIGSYPITCTVGTLAAQNYQFSFTPGTLTLTEADVYLPLIGR